jgi:hypothetical protein
LLEDIGPKTKDPPSQKPGFKDEDFFEGGEEEDPWGKLDGANKGNSNIQNAR